MVLKHNSHYQVQDKTLNAIVLLPHYEFINLSFLVNMMSGSLEVAILRAEMEYGQCL
jgi:hypothetical protein